MKSIQNQYRDLKEGRMSQANFMRNLRMTMPQYVTNVTSFNDAVKILKNKAILTETLNENRAFDIAKKLRDEYKMDEEAIYVYLVDDMGLDNMTAQSVVDQLFSSKMNEGSNSLLDEVTSEMENGNSYAEAIAKVAAAHNMNEDKLATMVPEEAVGNKAYADNYTEPVDDTDLDWTNENKDEDAELEDLIDKYNEEESGKYTKFQDVPGTISEDKKKKYQEPKLHPNQINPDELRMGIKVELEHTDNLDKAKKIALDHLAENPYYYTALKLSGIESPSAPKVKAPVEKKTKKKKESIQLVDLVNGMKKVKMPKIVKEAIEMPDSLLSPDVNRLVKFFKGNSTFLNLIKNLNSVREFTDFFGELVKLTDDELDRLKISDSQLQNMFRKAVIDKRPTGTTNPVDTARRNLPNTISPGASGPGQSLNKLREMVRQELAEYEKGDENDAPPSKKTAANDIAEKLIDDLAPDNRKEYKKSELDDVFSSYEDKMGHRYGNEVFQDVIDILKSKGYSMKLKEYFDGRDNLADEIAAEID